MPPTLPVADLAFENGLELFLREILHRVGIVDNRDDGIHGDGRTVGLDAALFGKLHFAALDVARAHGDVGKTVNQRFPVHQLSYR